MITATTAYKTALAAYRNGLISFLIQIEGYSRGFTNDTILIGGGIVPWLVSIDDCQTSINDLDGTANTTQLMFTVQDDGGAITGDFPGFVFEGAKVTLKCGLPGLSQSDFPTVFTGYIDEVASANSNTEYYFTCSDVSVKLQQTVYLIGDNGSVTSSTNVKTLNGHPLDMLLDILNNQIINPDGSRGLDPSLIDTTKIEAYRDGPFDGIEFLFHLNQSPTAADFIAAQLLKPLGGYLWTNAAGQITVNFFYPLAGPVAVQTIGPANWIAIPEAEQTDMVNTVEFQFDKDDDGPNSTGNYLNQSVQEYGPSVSKYGLYGGITIAADGVRSAFQGYFIAGIVARLIFLRYGFKSLMFDQAAPDSIWNTMLLEPGDIVAVTHPDIPDRKAGTMGVTNKLFEVLHRTFKFSEGKMVLTMIDASYLSTFGFFEITGDSQADYISSSTGDKHTFMFMTGANGKYSNNDPGNSLG